MHVRSIAAPNNIAPGMEPAKGSLYVIRSVDVMALNTEQSHEDPAEAEAESALLEGHAAEKSLLYGHGAAEREQHQQRKYTH